jgi:transposase InsO family protein
MSADYPLTVLCAVWSVSRSGYHARAAGHRERHAQRDKALREAIQTAFDASPRRYGYPRLTVQLRSQGERVGKARLARLMRENALQGRARPKATTMAPSRPTASRTRRGGRLAPGLLLHADRGVPYTSARCRAQLAKSGLTASMSRRGNCHDNARAEAFFSTLKLERVYRENFTDHAHARSVDFEWIEAFYTLSRRHYAPGYPAPINFEHRNNGFKNRLRTLSTI